MNTPRLRVVASIAVGMLAALFLAAPLFGDADDPPGRAVRLSVVQGTVSLLPAGATDWSQATVNYPLTTGDRVYTDQGSRAELELGNVAVRTWESTDLTVANLTDQVLQLGFDQGSIRLRVYSLTPDESIEVDTPNGALTIYQPGDYRIETYPNDGATFALVDSGQMEVSGGGVSDTVESGQAVKLTGTEQILAEFVDMPASDDFDNWSRDRDRRFESSQSARYVGHSMPGYSDLDEYGRWDNVPEYGPVWYPVGVPAGWAPYRFGHWAWVHPWGWTWIDDQPWGFSPFHYGRWAMVGGAWGWIPGPVVVRPVYAPALVAFIGGPNFSIGISIGGGVGWFPLGPREPYNPWYHHSDDYARRVNVTNVTNITNINYVNQRTATSVVSTETFRTGQPVRRQLIPMNSAQMAQAQVIAHPEAAPAPSALGSGRPAVHAPPVRPLQMTPAAAQRPMQVTRAQPSQPGQPGPPPRPAQPPGAMNRTTPAGGVAPSGQPSGPPRYQQNSQPGAPPRPSAPPVSNRPAETNPEPPRSTPPPASTAPGSTGQTGNWRTFSRPAPGGGRTEPGGPTPAAAPTPPRVVTKTTPPPPSVPFPAQQPAMQQHPGRPLEPQQMDNLRLGKPAGPMHDQETLPHAAPPPQKQAPKPPPRSDKTDKGKSDKDQKH